MRFASHNMVIYFYSKIISSADKSPAFESNSELPYAFKNKQKSPVFENKSFNRNKSILLFTYFVKQHILNFKTITASTNLQQTVTK